METTMLIDTAGPEPLSESPTELLDLKDDSLIDIGRLLSLQDLNVFSSLCSRLNDIGRQVFVLDQANNALEIKECEVVTKIKTPMGRDQRYFYKYRGNACAPNFRRSPMEIRRYLRNFGDLIEKLTFESFAVDECGDQRVPYDKMTEHISTYSLFADVVAACSNGHLSDVQLEGFCWTPELAEMAQPLLCGLKKLRLVRCGKIDDILPKCNQLINLTAVDYVDRGNTKLDAEFPQLKKLVLNGTAERIEACLMRHRQLEQVKLYGSFNWSVLAKLHSIEKITIESDEASIIDDTKYPVDQSEACFSKLKSVKLTGRSRLLQPFLSKLAGSGAVHSMEQLEIVSCDDGNVLKIIPNMRKLEKLTVGDLNGLTIPMLAIQSTSNLRVFCVFHITIDDDFIRGLPLLPNLEQLKIHSSRMRASNAAMEELHDVTGLAELMIQLRDDTRWNSAKWLLNLGSTQTLKKLCLQGFHMDDNLIIGLSRFTELKSLDIQPVFRVLKRNKEMLEELCKLEEITLRFDVHCANFLYCDNSKNFKTFSLLHPERFINLRILKIHFGPSGRQLEARRIALLGQLHQVEELHLNDGYNLTYPEIPCFSSIVIETMDSLKTLLFDCHYSHKMPLTEQMYMQFVQVCHRKKKNITICLVNCFGIISFNINDIEHHECVRIVVDNIRYDVYQEL